MLQCNSINIIVEPNNGFTLSTPRNAYFIAIVGDTVNSVYAIINVLIYD